MPSDKYVPPPMRKNPGIKESRNNEQMLPINSRADSLRNSEPVLQFNSRAEKLRESTSSTSNNVVLPNIKSSYSNEEISDLIRECNNRFKSAKDNKFEAFKIIDYLVEVRRTEEYRNPHTKSCWNIACKFFDVIIDNHIDKEEKIKALNINTYKENVEPIIARLVHIFLRQTKYFHAASNKAIITCERILLSNDDPDLNNLLFFTLANLHSYSDSFWRREAYYSKLSPDYLSTVQRNTVPSHDGLREQFNIVDSNTEGRRRDQHHLKVFNIELPSNYLQKDKISSLKFKDSNEQWSDIDSLSIVTSENGIGKTKLLNSIHEELRISSKGQYYHLYLTSEDNMQRNFFGEKGYDFRPKYVYKTLERYLSGDNLYKDEVLRTTGESISNKIALALMDEILSKKVKLPEKGCTVESLKKLFTASDIVKKAEELAFSQNLLKEPFSFVKNLCWQHLEYIAEKYESGKSIVSNDSDDNAAKAQRKRDKLELVEKHPDIISPIVHLNKILDEYIGNFELEFKWCDHKSAGDIELLLYKKTKNSKVEVHPKDLSSGELVILKLALWSYVSKGLDFFTRTNNELNDDNKLPTKIKLLLLDEVDKHFDPKLVHKLIKILSEGFKFDQKTAQIIMTTHRIDTIALATKGSIFTIEQDEQKIQIIPTHPLLAMFRLTTNLREITNIHFTVYTEAPDDMRFYEGIYSSLKAYSDQQREKLDATFTAWSQSYISKSDWKQYTLSRRCQPSFHSTHSQDDGGGGGKAGVATMVLKGVLSSIKKYEQQSSLVDKKVKTLSDPRIGSPFGIIDRDFTKHKDKTDLKQELNNKIVVLQRHSIESYLLDPFIICSALSIEDIKKIGINDNSHLAYQRLENIREILLDLKKSLDEHNTNFINGNATKYFIELVKYISDLTLSDKRPNIMKVAYLHLYLDGIIEQAYSKLETQKINNVALKDIIKIVRIELSNQKKFISLEGKVQNDLASACEGIKSESIKIINDRYQTTISVNTNTEIKTGEADLLKDTIPIKIILNSNELIEINYPRIVLYMRGHNIENFIMFNLITKDSIKFKEYLLSQIQENNKLYIPYDLAETFFELNTKLRQQMHQVLEKHESASTAISILASSSTNSDNVVDNGANNLANRDIPLSIDASIYNPNYNKAFKKLATDIHQIVTGIHDDAVQATSYLLDYSKYKNPEIHNSPSQLTIENEQDHFKTKPNAKHLPNFILNNILYKTSLWFKGSDSIIDVYKLSVEPTIEHAKELLRNCIHLQSMIQGNNFYSLSLSAIDVACQLSQNEIKQAGIQLTTTAIYMLLPTIGSLVVPKYSVAVSSVYTATILTYTGYSTTSKLYSLYLNHSTLESQLRSNIAYGKLFDYWGLKDYAKDYLLNAMIIVEENKKSADEQEQCTEIQQIAEESNLAGMLAYYGIDCSLGASK